MPCQLYKFLPSTKVWQECGRGILHLNDSKSSDDEIIHSRIGIYFANDTFLHKIGDLSDKVNFICI